MCCGCTFPFGRGRSKPWLVSAIRRASLSVRFSLDILSFFAAAGQSRHHARPYVNAAGEIALRAKELDISSQQIASASGKKRVNRVAQSSQNDDYRAQKYNLYRNRA